MNAPLDELLIEMVTVGPFAENCFIVADAATKQGILIDPGDQEELILARVRQLDVTIIEIVNTHSHIDHVGAVASLKRSLGVPFALHPAERPVLAELPFTAQMFGLPPKEMPEIDRELQNGDKIVVGTRVGRVLATPGHTPGGCSIFFEQQRAVFVGDTLFAGSIGRTDLPGGNHRTLLTSIREQLLTLPDEVIVYCGHGPQTTIGDERRHNPFLGPAAK